MIKANLNKKSKFLIMEIVKFKEEIITLKKFFEIYCKEKHEGQENITKVLIYKNEEIHIDLYLCSECLEKINYSFERLQSCPHEIKPRCRTCANPCYEKKNWKETAQVMRYSGLKLGLKAINKKMKNLFS